MAAAGTARTSRVSKALRNPQLLAAFAFGGGGVAFSVANLVLARELDPIAFATFALVVAVLNLSVSISALGLDGIVIRRLLPPTPALLRRSALTALGVAAGVAAVSAVLYPLPAAILAALFLGVAAGGPWRIAAAVHQSRREFTRALPLAQSDNILVLLAALLVVVAPGAPTWIAIGVVTVGRVLVASAGWSALLRRGPRAADAAPAAPIGWGEQLSLVSIGAAGAILVQLDRLVIPKVLPLEALATFGVLAAVVGAPFRVLQLAAGYTLAPRLRATADPRARRRLIVREGAAITLVLVVASMAVWVAIPLIVEHFLEGRYRIGNVLILATLFAGAAKVADAFIVAIVSALGGERELARLGAWGWATCALSVAAGAAGARFGGLSGVVLGVSLGWWARAAAAGWLARGHVARAPLPSSVG